MKATALLALIASVSALSAPVARASDGETKTDVVQKIEKAEAKQIAGEKDKINEESLLQPGSEKFLHKNAPYSVDPNRQCPPEKVVCNGLYPVRPASANNRVGLLINGEASLAARLMTLRMAKHSIHIEALEFTGDETGHYVAEILKQKAAEGLDVRVIVDGFSNKALETKLMYLDMMKAGVKLLGAHRGYAAWAGWIADSGFLHPKRINMRFHEKLWVIDGEDKENGVAILGGMNIANGYLRVGPKPFRDQDVIVKGDIVGDAKVFFDSNFHYHSSLLKKTDLFSRLFGRVTGLIEDAREHIDNLIHRHRTHNFIPDPDMWRTLLLADPLTKSAAIPGHPVASFLPELAPSDLQIFRNYPRRGERLIAKEYVKLIGEAAASDNKEILIANAYFLPPKDIEDALMAAVRAGARLTILTNSLATTDIKRLSIISRFRYKKYLQLNDDPETRRNGGFIRIFEWNGDNGPGCLLHAKFAVFGRQKFIVGSYNLDPRSEHLNSEDAIVVSQPELASQLAAQYLGRDLAKSTEILMPQAERFQEVLPIFGDVLRKFRDVFEVNML